MKKETVITICRGLLILLFIYASFSKIFDPALSKRQMMAQPFPTFLSWGLLFLIPASEIVLSVLLMIESKSKKALLASVILMGMFTVYITTILLNFFNRVPCSCGGVIEKLTWGQHLVFNLFFLGVALTGYLMSKSKTIRSNLPQHYT
ncbi:MauE/DoxX family redox-associated membrane protein [Chitinophaga tropicalis]|uniref:Methylamine utilisation protein MauE domain-containing protein n=1 Tax=Chitinophaga tropicalis TaxID=2683588 RepID=A0A7K1U040_9BACT|nr:MauE/DoxX family redox-associated membrane protein [Chitinophaga tropicalis]MVT07666.1 hypothetical protein [Chitinophaga tropicalis]